MTELIYKNESYLIIGAAIEVNKELGCGFLEAIYQEAFAMELTNKNIVFSREVSLPIFYKGKQLQKYYCPDFVCYNSIIVELKAVNTLDTIHEAQVINYLKATGLKLGLLINFGEKSLKYKRLVL
jgi:GxxExxY protein